MKKLRFLLFIFIIFICGCNNKVYVSFVINKEEVVEKKIFDESFSLPTFNTPEGKKFVGWYFDKNYQNEYKGEKINKSTTLYAKFEDIYYYVTFRDKNKNLITTEKVKHGDGAISPSDDKIYIPGWTFLGWSEDISCITSDISVYGKYVEDYYQINFDVGEGTKVESISNLRYGDVIHLQNDVTNEGYVFAGWTLNDEFVGDDFIVTNNATLVAKWADTNVKYEIIFDSNGGNEIDKKIVHEFSKVSLPISNRDGFTFIGWLYNNEKMNNDFIYTYENGITLKAMWERDEHEFLYEYTTTITTIRSNGEPRVEEEKTSSNVNYFSSLDKIMIPNKYVSFSNKEFRGINIVFDDFKDSITVDDFKNKIKDIIDLVNEYKLNTIIFEVRSNNEVYYNSSFANVNANIKNLNDFDFIEYFINQCKINNIDFIALFDMCTIDSKNVYNDCLEVSKKYQSLSNLEYNPAQDENNIILASYKYPYLKLNKEEVQIYLLNIIDEFTSKYEMTAIEISDTFYGQRSGGKRLLEELDQSDFEEYVSNNPSLNIDSKDFSNKEKWRREIVDDVVKRISELLRNKQIPFGVSVSGMYLNGDGVINKVNDKVQSSGSLGASNQYSHYNNNFCDSINWMNNSWIDFIIPRIDKTISYTNDSFASSVDWWNEVCINTNTLFISTLGVKNYLTKTNGFTVSSNVTVTRWNRTTITEISYETILNEIYNEVLYLNKYNTISGFCFDSYEALIDEEIKNYKGIIDTKYLLNNYIKENINLIKENE